jgi:hypothetical protein
MFSILANYDVGVTNFFAGGAGVADVSCNALRSTFQWAMMLLLRAVENGGGGRPKMVALGW